MSNEQQDDGFLVFQRYTGLPKPGYVAIRASQIETVRDLDRDQYAGECVIRMRSGGEYHVHESAYEVLSQLGESQVGEIFLPPIGQG